jgi:uncharacterized protein (TIGR03435 family)
MKLSSLVVGLCILACLTMPMQSQSSTDDMPGIEVSTVKPSNPNIAGGLFTVRGRHFMTINTTVGELIRFAYGLSPKQVENVPAWITQEKFDVDALTDRDGAISDAQMQDMTQALLTHRFNLRFHREKKELEVYALTVAKGGPKLTKTKRSPQDNTDFYGPRGELIVRNATMQAFAIGLSRGLVNRPVDDRTGLTDRYDFDLKWTPDDATANDPTSPPGFYTALQEQLGLKLAPAKGSVEVFMIDDVSRPSAN